MNLHNLKKISVSVVNVLELYNVFLDEAPFDAMGKPEKFFINVEVSPLVP